MTQLVILVVAAAWLAVLIPPMLRSRVENRPNSSVTDFRRQLDKLQHTAAPRPAMRTMGRPLAPAGAGRPVRTPRPERPVLRSGVTAPQPADVDRFEADEVRPIERREPVRTGGGRYRSHGDPTGGQRRPVAEAPALAPTPMIRSAADARRERREHTAPGGLDRPVDLTRRRRANVLFLLVGVTACTLFLAATTASTVMFYAFALSFLGLIGYVYLLAQTNQRASLGGFDAWPERY
ncbi:MAG: hypothetical protein AAFP84_05720 [Actinomycetota bacterium]